MDQPEQQTDDQPRGGDGRWVRTVEVTRRDAAAAEMRSRRPVAATYKEIAETLGYADKGEAWRGVQRAMRDIVREPAERLIQVEAAEIDALYVEALEILERNHITVSNGRIITMRDPDTGKDVPLPDDGPKLAALQTALKLRESYRRLFGLDAATKTEVSGGLTYEIVGVDMEALK
ncbi:hypothetical protein ACFW1M_22825 [Streptomyces inhibens]|uniref:hypothetical protein n=1 Tax=Streptomyces inhibens TaxID=2293571 RepID=UPI0036793EA8